MIEKIYLNTDNLPNLFCPHDCVIKEVLITNEYLTFIFEDDISYHDSVMKLKPLVKTLIIKYHLIDDMETYLWKRHKYILKRNGYILTNNNILIKLTSKRLEYLYHNIGYQSLIIKLWSSDYILLDLQVDYIEYEWIYK